MIALGFKLWNLFGGSYGLPLAQMALRQYPKKVRAVVFSWGWDQYDGLAELGSVVATGQGISSHTLQLPEADNPLL